MITLQVGRTLGAGDLNLMVRDAQGVAVVPASINYTIFAVGADGSKSLATAPRQIPTAGELGFYYITMTIPSSWAEGNYQLVWYLQQTASDPEITVVEDIAIMQLRPGAGSLEAPSVLMAKRLGVTEKVAEVIMSVRELLSDTNPDRNYHFRPPTAATVVAGYTTRVGFIWTDQTIMRMLKLALATANTANPKALYDHRLETLNDENWKQAIALGAAAHCLTSEAARWIADEFGYSLNGVSLDLEKSGKYQGLGQQYMAEFTQWLAPLTANRPKSVGLRQPRFLR